MKSFLNVYGVRVGKPRIEERSGLVVVYLTSDVTLHVKDADEGDLLSGLFAEAAAKLREAEQVPE